MNIQIWGTLKSFDVKKAQRYFKERRIPFQFVDINRYPMSGKEFDSVLRAVGGIDKMIDWSSTMDAVIQMRYMDDIRGKEDKAFSDQRTIRMPIVRNGKLATVGYCPDTWEKWISQAHS